MDEERRSSVVDKYTKIYEDLETGKKSSYSEAITTTDPNRGQLIADSLESRIPETTARLNRSPTNASPPPVPPRPRRSKTSSGNDDSQTAGVGDEVHREATQQDMVVNGIGSDIPKSQPEDQTTQERVYRLENEFEQVKKQVEILTVENKECSEKIKALEQERDKLQRNRAQLL